MRIVTILCALICMALMIGPTKAAEFVEVNTQRHDSWDAVLYRNVNGNRLFCAAESWSDQTVMRINRYRDSGEAFLEIYDDQWAMVEGDARFSIVFGLEGHNYSKEMAGRSWRDSYTQDLDNFDYAIFTSLLSQAKSIELRDINNVIVATFDGAGSESALAAFSECVAGEQDGKDNQKSGGSLEASRDSFPQGIGADFYWGVDHPRFAGNGRCEDVRFTRVEWDIKTPTKAMYLDATDCREEIKDGTAELIDPRTFALPTASLPGLMYLHIRAVAGCEHQGDPLSPDYCRFAEQIARALRDLDYCSSGYSERVLWSECRDNWIDVDDEVLRCRRGYADLRSDFAVTCVVYSDSVHVVDVSFNRGTCGRHRSLGSIGGRFSYGQQIVFASTCRYILDLSVETEAGTLQFRFD